LRQALDMQKRGDVGGADKLLTDAKRALPFANCEFATSLAVIYYTSNRKDQALQELESIQAMVNPASRPQCARSQYLLGSLYKEMSRSGDAANAFRAFLSNTDGSNDPEIVGFRNSIKSTK
jgi:cytochrome c-type biogenesis protein CcmH/NrfG